VRNGPRLARVAVVGAYIAFHVARAGARVAVVERRFPRGGTSGATFATVGTLGQTPRSFRDLHAAGIDAHVRLAREIGGAWLHLDSALYWESDDRAARTLEAEVTQENA
jgi:glycine/D-amino acid oxidase-like deaminating enzyme